MADDSSKLNKTQLVVALIGLGSAVTVAVIANIDKLSRPSPPKVAAGPSSAASSLQATSVDISGYWHDDDGYQYAFKQDGDSYSYQQLRKGRVEGSGAGHLHGRALQHDFSTANGGGSCEGIVSEDASMVSGTCGEGANRWPFSLQRGSS